MDPKSTNNQREKSKMEDKEPSPTSKPRKKENRLPLVLGAVILLLLALNAFFLMDRVQTKSEIAKQSKKIEKLDAAKLKLDTEYNEAMAQLEGFRSKNNELNIVIEAQKEKLKKQKQEIDRYLRRAQKGEVDAKRLAEAQERIRQFSNVKAQSVAKIETLKKENKELAVKAESLESEKEELESEVKVVKEEKDELAEEKESLKVEKEVLVKKVNKASVIEVKNFTGKGVRLRNNGAEKEVVIARRAEKLKVCFDITVNKVAEPGSEIYYVRIIDPKGKTMALENSGSGSLTLENGDDIRFSTIKSFDYNQESASLCVYWRQNLSYIGGNYFVEVYNKGYLAGKGGFKLR